MLAPGTEALQIAPSSDAPDMAMRFTSEAISAYLVLMIEFIFDLSTDVTVWYSVASSGEARSDLFSKERLVFPQSDSQSSMEAQRVLKLSGFFEGSAR